MFRTKQTDADLSAEALAKEERREKARLRSERWRRAHGIGPRRPAQQPWLAEGISRSTWYRRRKRARDAATACAIFARAESFAAALTRDLARCAALERQTMAIIAELSAIGPVLRSLGEGGTPHTTAESPPLR
jgi:hypothetical protein